MHNGVPLAPIAGQALCSAVLPFVSLLLCSVSDWVVIVWVRTSGEKALPPTRSTVHTALCTPPILPFLTYILTPRPLLFSHPPNPFHFITQPHLFASSPPNLTFSHSAHWSAHQLLFLHRHLILTA